MRGLASEERVTETYCSVKSDQIVHCKQRTVGMLTHPSTVGENGEASANVE